MRIAQVIPYDLHPYSGIFQAVVELSVALARRGTGVEVWQLEAWPDGARPLAETLDAESIERVIVPMSRKYWRLSAAANNCISQRSVDIVHFHGAFSPINNLVARELKVPYALSPHGGYAPGVLQRHPLRKVLFKHLFERPMIASAAALWALTGAEKEDIDRFCRHGSIAVGPSGYEPVFLDADPMRFRAELGIAADDLLGVFVGRLDVHYKRLDVLVRSLSGAPGWHLALVGPDWKNGTRKLERFIRQLRLGDRVHVVDPRRGRALHEALAAANLFILMSRSEGLPLALLAALSHGVPALISPAVERAVGLGAAAAGWVCRPDDLAETLAGLSGLDACQWMNYKAAAARQIKLYQWDRTLGHYVTVMAAKTSPRAEGPAAGGA